jgi:hypothetical protein
MAARAQQNAATMKDSTIDGPATLWAAFPVKVKMPAPMTTPTPKTVRSRAVSDFFNWYSGSSVSASDCSMLLVLNRFIGGELASIRRFSRKCCAPK